jgi:hypothetical protein
MGRARRCARADPPMQLPHCAVRWTGHRAARRCHPAPGGLRPAPPAAADCGQHPLSRPHPSRGGGRHPAASRTRRGGVFRDAGADPSDAPSSRLPSVRSRRRHERSGQAGRPDSLPPLSQHVIVASSCAHTGSTPSASADAAEDEEGRRFRGVALGPGVSELLLRDGQAPVHGPSRAGQHAATRRARGRRPFRGDRLPRRLQQLQRGGAATSLRRGYRDPLAGADAPCRRHRPLGWLDRPGRAGARPVARPPPALQRGGRGGTSAGLSIHHPRRPPGTLCR